MQLSNSIPAPGFGGPLPSSSTVSADLPGRGLNPSAAPADFALLFAGVAAATPGGGPAPVPCGAGAWVSEPSSDGDVPDEDGDGEADLSAADGESEAGTNNESLAAAVLPVQLQPENPAAACAVALAASGEDGATEREAAETSGIATEPTVGEARRSVARAYSSPSVRANHAPAAVFAPRSENAETPKAYRSVDTAPAGTDEAGFRPERVPAVPAAPLTPATPATSATPATPATPATATTGASPATPAVPATAANGAAPAAAGGPGGVDRPIGRQVTPAGAKVALPGFKPSGPTEVPVPAVDEANAGEPTTEGVAVAAEVAPASEEDASPDATPAAGKRRPSENLPAGLALGRNRAEAMAAAAATEGPRPPAPGLARAAVEPGADSRSLFRRPSAAVEVPAEKIAAAANAAAAAPAEPAQKSERSFLEPSEEGLTHGAAPLGTGVAKGEPAMSLTNFQRRPLSDFVPPMTSFMATTDAGETTRTPGFSETASASRVALRAVNAVAEVKEQIAAGGSSVVNMRFSVAGADLAVRVESRSGEVHVTFRSDSAELRTALAEEWQAVSASEAGRPLRAIDPVFAAAGSSARDSAAGDAGGDAAMNYQRDPESRHPDDSPVPSRTTQRFPAGQTARAPQVAPPRAHLVSSQSRLQAFA